MAKVDCRARPGVSPAWTCFQHPADASTKLNDGYYNYGKNRVTGELDFYLYGDKYANTSYIGDQNPEGGEVVMYYDEAFTPPDNYQARTKYLKYLAYPGTISMAITGIARMAFIIGSDQQLSDSGRTGGVTIHFGQRDEESDDPVELALARMGGGLYVFKEVIDTRPESLGYMRLVWGLAPVDTSSVDTNWGWLPPETYYIRYRYASVDQSLTSDRPVFSWERGQGEI